MVRNIKVNAEAFDNGSFGPIPVGTRLNATIYEVTETVSGPNSKNPGSPQFHYTAKITDDFLFEHTDEAGKKSKQNAKGRELKFNYVPLDPNVKHAWNLVQFAEAVGWAASKEEGIAVPDNLKEVQGTPVVVKIGQNAGQDGNIYNNVTKVFKAGAETSAGEAAAVAAQDTTIDWGSVK